MRIRRLLNRWWVGLPILSVAALILGKQIYPYWLGRSEQFRGAAFGVAVYITGGLFAYWLTRFFDRWMCRYNALCRMELTLNHLIVALSDNQYQLDLAIKSDELTVIYARSMPIEEEDIQDIGRVALKNTLLEVLIDCEKYVHDLKFSSELLDRNVQISKELYGRQSTDPQHIKRILNDIYRKSKPQLKVLYDYGKLVEEAVKAALVDVQFFCQNDRPPFVGLVPFYAKGELERWRVRRRAELEKEMAATAAADEARRKKQAQEV